MAGRPRKTRALAVWMNGERVGEWHLSASATHSFAYDASWLAHPQGRPLSLSLPLPLLQGSKPIAGERVGNYFDNLLPDSPDIRKRLAQKFAAGSAGVFDLLERIGRDCVGAVQLLPAAAAAPDVRRIDAEALDEAAVARLLDRTLAVPGQGSSDEDELRISLAGAQEKTALLHHDGRWCRPRGCTPTTHILKLPLGEVGGMRADFSTSVENEWLCARLAQAFGLPAADCEIARFGRYKVLVVRRFDRRLIDGQWWARLPQEDFCQALGIAPERKYEAHGGPGIAAILDTLRGSETAGEDRQRFLAAQLFFWLLAAPDGHAKNFSLFIEAGGRFRLTPLYDMLSAWPAVGRGARQLHWQKLTMAMAVSGANRHCRMAEIGRRHWNDVARVQGLGSDCEALIARFIERAPAAVEAVSKALPDDFPARVSEQIFAGVLAQIGRLAR
jgi:serine/threonine-protein kinase HipA